MKETWAKDWEGGKALWKGRKGGEFEGRSLAKDLELRKYASSQFPLAGRGSAWSRGRRTTNHRIRLTVV